MTRLDIGLQNVFLPDGRMIKKGCIRMEDESIPVDLAYSHDMPIGYATDYQVDDNGVMSVDVEVSRWLQDNPSHQLKDFEGNFFVTEVKYKNDNWHMKILIDGRLRAVTLVPTSAKPLLKEN